MVQALDPVRVTSWDREKLRRLVRSSDGRVVRRAQVILLARRGRPVREIASLTGFTGEAVRLIKHRWNERGEDALRDAPRSGRPPRVTGEYRKRLAEGELKIRPIWHQLEKRVQAHVLFSFLAYATWKTLQTWMERSGLGRGARTVIEEFARIKAADVILPTSAGREVRLTCVTRPDGAQRAIIDRLGLELPERLSRPHWVRRPSELEAECSLDFSSTTPRIGR